MGARDQGFFDNFDKPAVTKAFSAGFWVAETSEGSWRGGAAFQSAVTLRLVWAINGKRHHDCCAFDKCHVTCYTYF